MKEWAAHNQSALMAEIIAVRYSDLEQEKLLCERLLCWAEGVTDAYALAFAHTYLGDYFLAKGHAESAEYHLQQAREALDKEEALYPALAAQAYNLLGIYFETQSDEQSCVRCYLKAAAFAKRIDDAVLESVVLNNLAFVFQQRRNNEEAQRYYLEAYALKDRVGELPILSCVLGNLIELSIEHKRFSDALRYIEEFNQLSQGEEESDFSVVRNKCYYYVALRDRDQALVWAQRILDEAPSYNMEGFAEFDNYYSLFECMMSLEAPSFAQQFLALMEKAADKGGIERAWRLEEKRIEYCLAFEPREKHQQAFEDYFEKAALHRQRINEVVVKAMHTQIDLAETIIQREKLLEEQENLEYEASRDELTGIYNRRHLNRLLALRGKKYEGAYLGLVMIDVDYFKEYNDLYGHLGGDDVLSQVSSIIWSLKDNNIQPCRYGGDEIACLCDNMDAEAIEVFLQAIRQELAHRALEHKGSPYGVVTLSIGYATAPVHLGIPPLSLLQYADRALYSSKQQGRNACTQERVG